MQRVPLSARVSADLDSSARAKAAAEGVSLSAIVERALAAYLSQADNQPASASELEKLAARVRQLEAQQSSHPGRKGKYRR